MGIKYCDLLMWKCYILGTLPFICAFVFLVYIVETSSMELGLQQEPKHSSLGFLFLFVCFLLFSSSFCHSSPPSSGACWIQQSQLYQSWPLGPHWFWILSDKSPTDRTCLLPSSQHTCNQAAYSCCGASFQPYISVHYLQPSGTWLCFSSWSLVSISAPLGPGFKYSGTLIGGSLSLPIWYRSRYLSRKVSTLLSLYLVIIPNPQSHLIYTQFIIHLDYQKTFYFPIFTLSIQ